MSKLGNKLGQSKLGPASLSILEAGRAGDDPTPADRARVKRAVMRSIAAGTALGATSTAGAAAKGAVAASAVSKAASLGLGIKLLGVLALVGAVGAGVLLQRAGSPDPASTEARSIVAAPANAAPPSPDPALAETGTLRAGEPVSAAAPPRPSEPVAAEKASPPAPSARALNRPTAAAPAELPPVEAEVKSPAAAPAPAEDPLEAETRRLREAHGALQAGDPQKALGLLGEQGGQLGEERAAARVLALCQMGHVAEAEAARAAFLREHPRSPLADRVRGGCAVAPSK